MQKPQPTPEELRAAWRDAATAAELAARLATEAADALAQADEDALAAEDLAQLAEVAAVASELAARRARGVADQASGAARRARERQAALSRRVTERPDPKAVLRQELDEVDGVLRTADGPALE